MKILGLIILLIPVAIFQSFIISDSIGVARKNKNVKSSRNGEIVLRDRHLHQNNIRVVK